MTACVLRISFANEVPLEEAEMTLQLATFAAEGLFGAARVRLDFSYHIDAERRMILADGTSEVGITVVRMYAGLLLREFGDDAFRVERAKHQPEGVAA